MSVVEQRFHAVMEVQGGSSKTEVAARYGVLSRVRTKSCPMVL